MAAISPIQHVVILVKENHTFDNYFGTFPGANGIALAHASDPINAPYPDPPHDHSAWLRREASAVRQQYTKDDIPAYWAYAQQFTLCDSYFTDVAGQSEPNHLMLIAADSPIIDNASAHRAYQPQPPYDLKSLPAALAAAQPKLDWRNYADEHESYFKDITDLAADGSNVPSAQFDADVANNYLPAVAWLYAPEGFSEHPPDPRKGEVPNPVIRPGMEWTVERVKKVASSDLWASTVIFITWDDWGGWYDHVAPPDVQSWDGNGPAGYAGSQFRYGPRVPCLVISPYAKKGINSTFHSHVSLVKFCLRVFGLQPFSNAPAFAPGDQSDDMWDCFDFAAAPRLALPSLIPL